MKLPIYQVDAFSSRVFSGNPAAVCPLDSWLDDDLMQSIALENNLSETVFFVPDENGFHIRWFTPLDEVKLCGHATLAAAYVLFEILDYEQETIQFSSLSGPLTVYKKDDLLFLDFPTQTPEVCELPEFLTPYLNTQPIQCLKEQDYLFIFENEKDVQDFNIDMSILKKLDLRGLIVSAPSSQSETDFVSRFFAPKFGIEEDPVTGSAHTQLIPYWSAALNKTELNAQQISPRGGELVCELHDDRVHIGGSACLFLSGIIYL